LEASFNNFRFIKGVAMRIVACLLFAAALIGCQSRALSGREKGALGGAAVGAGVGAIIGNQSGNAGAGTAIGGALGAATGAVIGNEIDRTEMQVAQRSEQMAAQRRELEANRRLIEELRARGADARQTERGVVVNLPDVLFEFARSELTGEAKQTIRQIAEVLQGVQGRQVSVEGHTDSIGTVAYNQRLSEDRARNVADELVRRGISRSRIVSHGYGESNPIATNRTDYGRMRNRRVEVVVENSAVY
jgi:outer membrane protein OmpA-like peptidoglycan-associated protein